MANLQKVNFDYIKKWEGGLSHNQKDSASRNPVPSTPAHPNPKGTHTNVGVTWLHGLRYMAVVMSQWLSFMLCLKRSGSRCISGIGILLELLVLTIKLLLSYWLTGLGVVAQMRAFSCSSF
jgi:hypothetical protein